MRGGYRPRMITFLGRRRIRIAQPSAHKDDSNSWQARWASWGLLARNAHSKFRNPNFHTISHHAGACRLVLNRAVRPTIHQNESPCRRVLTLCGLLAFFFDTPICSILIFTSRRNTLRATRHGNTAPEYAHQHHHRRRVWPLMEPLCQNPILN